VRRQSENREYNAILKDSPGISTYIKNWIYHLRPLIGTSRQLLKLKVFLQGPFIGGVKTTALNAAGIIPFNSNTVYNTTIYGYTAKTVGAIPNANVVDWILVELRTGTAASTKVETQAAFLLSNGSVVDVDGSSDVTFNIAIAGNYYIVIRHRNHLAIMSAVNVPLSNTSVYDFTTSKTKAYSSNSMAALGSSFGLMIGDANSNSAVNAANVSFTLSPANFNQSGYYNADVNFTRAVNAADVTVIFANLNKNSAVP